MLLRISARLSSSQKPAAIVPVRKAESKSDGNGRSRLVFFRHFHGSLSGRTFCLPFAVARSRMPNSENRTPPPSGFRRMTTTPVSLLERLKFPADQPAWSRFVDLYSPLIYSWAHQVGLQPTDAADLV